MKAEYICADQPVHFIFRLRQSGGPYIPVCPSFARIHRYVWHPFFSSENKLGSAAGVSSTTYLLIHESLTTDPQCIDTFSGPAQSGGVE